MFISLQTRMCLAQEFFILLKRSSGQSVETRQNRQLQAWHSETSFYITCRLLTVCKINISWFVFRFGLEVSYKGVHTLKTRNFQSNFFHNKSLCRYIKVITVNLGGWCHEVDGLHFRDRLPAFEQILHN